MMVVVSLVVHSDRELLAQGKALSLLWQSCCVSAIVR
jgi:hypothetical protein